MIDHKKGYIIDYIKYTGPRFLRPLVFLIMRFWGWRRCQWLSDNHLVKYQH